MTAGEPKFPTSYQRQVWRSWSPAKSGATVDRRLRSLMEQLGEAIDSSLSDSEQIAEVITRIKSGGYDVFLARGDDRFP
jgi:hypothetical protein